MPESKAIVTDLFTVADFNCSDQVQYIMKQHQLLHWTEQKAHNPTPNYPFLRKLSLVKIFKNDFSVNYWYITFFHLFVSLFGSSYRFRYFTLISYTFS